MLSCIFCGGRHTITPSDVLLIGGRSGVGKSTVAIALHRLLISSHVPHAVIEGDYLDMAYPAAGVRGSLVDANLRTTWARYREAGIHRLVYTNTTSVVEIERLSLAIGGESKITAVLLRATDHTTRPRLTNREAADPPRADLDHSSSTAHALDRQADSRVIRVDTDNLTPREIASRLAHLMGWITADEHATDHDGKGRS